MNQRTQSMLFLIYRVYHMFENDIATYVSLNWLEISVSFRYDVPIRARLAS
jgi:hypothetical protein